MRVAEVSEMRFSLNLAHLLLVANDAAVDPLILSPGLGFTNRM